MEKNIKYYTATNHKKLDVLQKLVGKRQHAVVLDQFLFWSINSTFKLPKSDTIDNWFCYQYEDMAAKLCISESTLYRLVKKFVDLGLIQRLKMKLMGDTRACFRATTKLINIAKGISTSKVDNKVVSKTNITDDCSENKQHDSCTSIKMTDRHIKEYNYSEAISNITFEKFKPTVDNSLKKYTAIFAEVGERLIPEQKQYIARTIENLKTQHKIEFSVSNQEMFAQLVYSVLNSSCVSTAKTLNHRINIFAKALREGRWRTPKGFYKYWDIGQRLGEKQQLKEKKRVEDKQHLKGWELKQITDNLITKKSELVNKLSFVRGDMKQLPVLMKANPDELENQLQKAKVKEFELLSEINMVVQKISNIESAKTSTDLALYERGRSE